MAGKNSRMVWHRFRVVLKSIYSFFCCKKPPLLFKWPSAQLNNAFISNKSGHLIGREESARVFHFAPTPFLYPAS